MSKYSHNKQPKYETDYSKSLSRKVFYKRNFILQELKLSSTTGAGHISDVDGYDNHADLRDRMDAFLTDVGMRARISNIIYRMFDNKGLACCLLRKMILMEPMTIKKIDEYLAMLCNKLDNSTGDIKPLSCLKYNERLIADIEHLLPADFEPKRILDVSGTTDSTNALSNRFPDAKITTKLESKSFDFVVLSHHLHHVNSDARSDLLKKITSALDPDGYLFVREMDVESTEDSDMSNFIHEVFYKSRISTLSYISKDALLSVVNSITSQLLFQSESQPKNDYFTNPLKNYFMLFKKANIATTADTKPKKIGKR